MASSVEQEEFGIGNTHPKVGKLSNGIGALPILPRCRADAQTVPVQDFTHLVDACVGIAADNVKSEV